MSKKIMRLTILGFFVFSCLCLIWVNSVANAIIGPYEQGQGFALNVEYDDGDLILTTTGGQGDYKYQYWIKEKVETDKGDSSVKNQFIWQLVGDGYTSSNTAKVAMIYSEGGEEYDLVNNYLDDSGKFNVIVRIKEKIGETEKVIEELYNVCTPEELGKPIIKAIEVNGKTVSDDYIVVEKSDLNVKIISNLTSGTFELCSGDNPIVPSNGDGIFRDLSLQSGLHTVTAKISGDNGTAAKKFKLYVYDEYAADQRPVIDCLDYSQDGSTATFKMYVKYADDNFIKAADISSYIFTLRSGDIKLSSKNPADAYFINMVTFVEGEDEYLHYIEFTVDYGEGNFGIYQTEGTVSRVSVYGYDDKVIRYYKGYATRQTSIDQTAQSDFYDSETQTYTVGKPIVITPSGTITEHTGNIKFAFYREDASGWVMIRDYKTLAEAQTFTWTPVRSGIYNIQVRIMDDAAGSYEDCLTKSYIVGENALSEEELTVNIIDCKTGEEAGFYIAGEPYKIEALYSGDEDVLYMFTLTNANLGTVYLNKYTPNPYYIFVPNKQDHYIITARVISVTNYGYKDISKSVNIDTEIPMDYIYQIYVDGKEVEEKTYKLIVSDSYIGTTGATSISATVKRINPDSEEGEFLTKGVQWSSTNDKVADFAEGMISGKSESGSTVITASVRGTAIGQVNVEGWTVITTKAHMDELALATWKLYNDVPKMERVLAGKYILGGDINYNGEYLLPIANARLTGFDNIGTSRRSAQSLTWKNILQTITPNWDYWEFGVIIEDKGGKESTFKGSNPLQKPFTGILDGNGYSIINAQLVYDNYLTRNDSANPKTFTASGAQFLGLNSGTLRNISFEDVRFTKNLGTLYDGVTIVSDWSSLSYAFAKSHFSTDANGLVYQNNASGVVENVFISFRIKTTSQYYQPSAIAVRDNKGTVKNVVVVHEGGTLPSTSSESQANSEIGKACALRHLAAVNTGTFTDSFAVYKPTTGSIDYVNLGAVDSNCVKVTSLTGAGENSLATKVRSGDYSLTSFDTDIWDIDLSTGSGTFMLKKGNSWIFD